MPEYTHGHAASVLKSHSWRTVDNALKFLIPELTKKSGLKILDVGCGPGTITCDLVNYISPDSTVTAIDPSAEVIAKAKAHGESLNIDPSKVHFEVGDIYSLKYANDSFDIVYCSMVLQHVPDPVKALKEMRRVTKAGGVVAARESDYGIFCWYPEFPELEEWHQVYESVARSNGGEPNAGRMLHSWARKAGFDRNSMTCTSSNWTYQTPAMIEWWATLWSERILDSNFAVTGIRNGATSREQLEKISKAFLRWKDDVDAYFVVPSGEIICRKG